MRSVWKCRTMEAVEKQKPLFHRSHNPWKSQGDTHIPTRRRRFLSPLSKPKPKAKTKSKNLVRYLVSRQPCRFGECQPTRRSKVSTITPVAHRRKSMLCKQR